MRGRVKFWAPDVASLGGPQVTQGFRYSEDLRFSSVGGEPLEGSEKAPYGCSVEASLCLGREKWRGSDGRRSQSSKREAGEVMESGCILKVETIGLDVEGERERGESHGDPKARARASGRMELPSFEAGKDAEEGV